MATLRKRNGRFQAQVRIRGSAPISKTFETKIEARRWAQSIEVAIADGSFAKPIRHQKSVTLGDILTRYQGEVTSLKKGSQREEAIIRTVRSSFLWHIFINDLTEDKAATYRNLRSRSVKPATVVRELALLAHSMEVARRDWGYDIKSNCFKAVRKPSVKDARTRRLTAAEKCLIFDNTHSSKTLYTLKLAEFALETAIRKGEMLNIRRRDINFNTSTLTIPKTKNGYPRVIPLSPRATDLLRFGMSRSSTEFVFSIEYWTLSRRWERFRRGHNIQDLRWHDLRHEAISVFFEKGLSIPEVALISGHRDTKLLSRYTHIRPENVASKLARLSEQAD